MGGRKIRAICMIAAGFGVLAATSAMATSYLYGATESFDGASVTLFITTDTNSGVLAPSDITSWDVSITDGSGSVDLTKLNSSLEYFGGGMSATSSALVFDFSATSFLYFQIGTPGDSQPYWCVTGVPACTPGPAESISVSTQSGDLPFESVNGLSGDLSIADFISASAPEPKSWALLLAGLAGLGALARARRRLPVTP